MIETSTGRVPVEGQISQSRVDTAKWRRVCDTVQTYRELVGNCPPRHREIASQPIMNRYQGSEFRPLPNPMHGCPEGIFATQRSSAPRHDNRHRLPVSIRAQCSKNNPHSREAPQNETLLARTPQSRLCHELAIAHRSLWNCAHCSRRSAAGHESSSRVAMDAPPSLRQNIAERKVSLRAQSADRQVSPHLP